MELMASPKTRLIAAIFARRATTPARRAAGILLRGLLIASLALCWLSSADSARASSSSKKKRTASAHSSKSTKSSKSSKSSKTAKTSGKSAKPKVSPDIAQLRGSNYPPEISARVTEYNKQAADINTLRKTDPKMAKARGDILAIEKESFDLYASLMVEIGKGEADKIRKAVAVNGWYKGMPQIAFVVSMGLPDDVESTPQKGGSQLKLMYKGSSFYFEKGRLATYQPPK